MQNEFFAASVHIAGAYYLYFDKSDKDGAYAEVAKAAVLLGVQSRIEDLIKAIISKMNLGDLMGLVSKMQMAEAAPAPAVVA